VRLCRRRFWKGEYNEDKISAYQTLYTCMVTIAKLAAPIAPFFMDNLFLDLNRVTGKEAIPSIHLADYPVYNNSMIDKELEERMQLAQQISSMVLSLRKKSNIKVRQPLGKIMLPVVETGQFKMQVERVQELILHEVNVKTIEFVEDNEGIFVKRIKPDFKKLGPKYGKIMKAIAARIGEMTAKEISTIEKEGNIAFTIEEQPVTIEVDDVEIFAKDIPGWAVANQGALTVALDITITENLQQEGYARELVNRIQNYRKEMQFDVVDNITVSLQRHPALDAAFTAFESYIKSETLCTELRLTDTIITPNKTRFEITDGVEVEIAIDKTK
jgi:isoleucyl-tRNA synthetase